MKDGMRKMSMLQLCEFNCGFLQKSAFHICFYQIHLVQGNVSKDNTLKSDPLEALASRNIHMLESTLSLAVAFKEFVCREVFFAAHSILFLNKDAQCCGSLARHLIAPCFHSHDSQRR